MPYFCCSHGVVLVQYCREIVKLTAQYTAVSGRQFLSGLARKEAGNPQFEFLKPTHVLFGYFTALCDQYAKVVVTLDLCVVRLMLSSNVQSCHRCLIQAKISQKR